MDIKQTLGASTLAVLTLVTPGNAQDNTRYRVEERPITLVGCVVHERDYRRVHEKGFGGPLQSGLGRGNEYVLVDAIEIAPGHAFPAGTDLSCNTTLGGRAYEMKGSNEDSLGAFVGRRIELSGIQARAEVRAQGADPTGGNTGGPQNFDLEKFEVAVSSVREPTVAEPPRAAIVREMEVTPQVTPTPAPSEPEPVATAGVQARAALPKTATPLPFTGLLGLLSVAAALGLRLARRS